MTAGVTSSSTEQARRLIFGRALRADVAVWILGRDDERFYLSEAMDAQAARHRSAVPQELERLVGAGLLTEEPRSAVERRRYFTRTDSPLWEVFRPLA